MNPQRLKMTSLPDSPQGLALLQQMDKLGEWQRRLSKFSRQVKKMEKHQMARTKSGASSFLLQCFQEQQDAARQELERLTAEGNKEMTAMADRLIEFARAHPEVQYLAVARKQVNLLCGILSPETIDRLLAVFPKEP